MCVLDTTVMKYNKTIGFQNTTSSTGMFKEKLLNLTLL
jgi:hypothetical protein